MLDQLFGDLEKKQADLKKTLSEVIIDHSYQDGTIEIKLNANKEVLNIKINPEKLDTSDTEQLEDLMVIAMNEALEMAEAKQAEHSQSLISDMIPGGLGNLFGS